MADWEVVSETPLAQFKPQVTGDGKPFSPTPPGALHLEIPGRGTQQTNTTAGQLPPEADALYGRIRKAEGTSSGDGFVVYGGDPFKPGKEHPGAEALRKGPQGDTHAAGPGQWQPDTWNGLKPTFKERFGRDPDFSSDDDQKAMSWLNAGKIYPGGEEKLREDIKSGKLDTAKLATQWAGFGKRDSQWAVTGQGKWNVSDEALRYEQGRSNTSVVWMSPDDYLGMIPDDSENPRPKRQSLMKSLNQGDQVEAIPTLDAKVEKGRLKLFDQDGRNRVQVAKEEGVDLIPVAVHGVGGEAPSWFQDMRGNVRRFDFDPVPKAAPQAPSRMERFGTGVLDVGYGAAQLGARMGPEEGGAAFTDPSDLERRAQIIDKSIADREAGIEAERKAAGQEGTDWWRVGGKAAATLPLALSVGAGGGGLAGAALTGAASSVLGGMIDPVTSGEFAPEKLKQLGFAAGFGAIAGPAGNLLGRAISPPIRNIADQARRAIAERFAERATGSGTSVGNVIERLGGARAEGQPMTLADIPELQGLAGSVSRATGEAGARMRSFFSGRRDDALRRLDDVLSRYLPTGSAKRTTEELASERAAAAGPVYQEAFEGGSIAPLEKTLQAEWNSAAGVAKNAEQNIARIENELNASLARQSTAGNVYSASSANKATTFAKDKIAAQRKIATEAREAEQAALQLLRRAQQDGTANAPGAIWSPTIQRLVTNPRVQVGIRKGMRIERDLADAEGRPMRLSEYAVTGTDEAGEPIVGAVPNMKLLAAAKKGLDSMVADMRSKEPPWRLTEEGRAVDKLRRTLLDELYRLNPKYKEANEIWSGGAESIRALTDGQRALNRSVSVEDVRDQLTKLPEGAKDFYRLGVADDARKDLLNVALSSDKSKAIVNSEAAREKLRVILGSPESAERFIQAIENERSMFNTERAVVGGSQTAERVVEDNTAPLIGAVHMGHAAGHLMHGNVPASIMAALRAFRELRGDKRLAKNPEMADELAKLFTDPGLMPSRAAGPIVDRLPPQLRPFAQRAAAESVRRLAPPVAYQWGRESRR